MATRLIRYYEEEFDGVRGMGAFRMAFRALFFVVFVVALSLLVLEGVLNHLSF